MESNSFSPVAVIGSHCECILENIKPEKNIHYVNEVYNESKRMGKMIKVLLEFNRINTLDTLKKEKVSLYELALEEADKIRPLCAAKNIELRVKPSDAQVLCDRTQIGLVLGNFLSNAVKFAPENAKILVYSKKEHSKVCLSVYNSGSHIEDADAQHIWEELYCADKSRTREGELTGMGLPINRVILQNHGFSYGFTNNANGVTFWFKE